MHNRIAGALLALTLASPSLLGGCRGPSTYEEYECPAPIGRIVREDCSHAELRYDGTEASAKVGVSSFGAEGSYKDKAVREADDVIAALKEQRSGLCQDFNTCKLSVEQYREEKQCLESTFTAVVTMKEGAQKVDGAGALQLAERVSAMRSSCRTGHSATASVAPAPPATPTPAPTPEPPSGWTPGRYMGQAVGSVAESAKQLEAKTKFGFDIDNACLLGAYVRKGKTIDMWQRFQEGREYVILGGGSEGAEDVDLGILDEDGKVIASDTDNDSTPVVKFKPSKSGKFGVRVALAAAKTSGSFVAVAVLHEGGYSIPAPTIVESFTRALSAAATASSRVSSAGVAGLVFHEQDNWSFYGTVLKANETSQFGGLALTADPSVVLAGGDSSAGKTKLSVKDGQSVVGTDTDTVAVVPVHPSSGHRYGIDVSNTGSSTSLYTVLVLDVQK